MPKRARPVNSDLKLLDPFWAEEVERTVLPNGLTLILKTDRSAPLVSVQAWVRTGSVHEGDYLGGGLSHFLEHMLFKGTQRREGREISAVIQAHGGFLNAYTTFDRTVYYADLPGEHAEVGVDVLADIVFHSTLPAAEVEKERNVILREIDMGRDDPEQRLGETLFETAFRAHPYRLPIIGHRDVFAGVSREALVAYYQDRYVPNNVVVVIVGDIDAGRMRETVARHFGERPRARLAPVPVMPEPRQLAPRSAHRYEAVELTRAGVGWQVPGLDHPDAPGLEVLGVILGNGDSSLLWQEVREKAGLVHAIDATCWNPGTNGLLYVSFTCEPGRRDAAFAAIERVVARLVRTGVEASRLRKAIRQLVVGEINTRKTMGGQASRLGSAEVVAGDLGFARAYFGRLQRLDSRELVRLARHYLVPEARTQVSLSPQSAAPARASGAGGAGGRDGFVERTLPNGARLLLQPDRRLPSVHLRFALRGGVAQEAAGQRGASGLLATLLTKDTAKATAAEVAERIEALGGSFVPFAGNNLLSLALEVLPPDVGEALEILNDAVLRPRFASGTFEREREAQIAGLQQDADDVVTYGRKRLRQLFFGDHPLALDAQGDPAGLAALTPVSVRRHYESLLSPSNSVLVATGDFDPAKLGPRLERLLRSLPRQDGPPGFPRFDGPSRGEHVERQPREQAVVFQAFPGPGLLEPDSDVSDVADELFSGMASRLFERVREEKGLAYFVRSSRVVGMETGMFFFLAGTAPVHAREVLTEIEAEIRRVADGGVEGPELRRCQERLKVARRQAQQTNASRALQAALNALAGLPINDDRGYDARIDAVTVADLATFARRRLIPEHRVQLVVGPEGTAG